VCYAAQGFDVVRNMVGELVTNYGTLPIKRLVAKQGPRNEPITYWMTVGDRATLSGLRQKLAQIRYGMTGKIPDGILVRVSSIGVDAKQSYAVQDRFINGLLGEMKDGDRVRVIGRFGA
jgi:EpsI family protein